MVRFMLSRFSTLFVACWIVFMLIANVRAEQKPASLWSITMPDFYRHAFWPRYDDILFNPRIFFLDNATLVYYQLEKRPDLLNRRELPLVPPSKYSLRLKFIDINSGRIMREQLVTTGADLGPTFEADRNIPELRTRQDLFPVADGIILKTGHTIRFLSRDASTILAEAKWSDIGKMNPDELSNCPIPISTEIAVSHTGKTVLIDDDCGSFSMFRQYSGQTFKMIRQWKSEVTGHQYQLSIDDSYLSFYMDSPPRGPYIQHFGDLLQLQSRSFFGGTLIELTGGQRSGLFVEQTNPWRKIPSLTERDHVIGTQLSEDDKVLAIDIEKWSNSGSWDFNSHATEFRTNTYRINGEVILSITSRPDKKNPTYDSALSMDGKWVAIFNGRQLTAYRLL